MQTKTCKKCDRALDIGQFYVHAQMADGHLSFCKDCVKERVGLHRAANIEAIRRYDRLRGNRQTKEYAVKYGRGHVKEKNEWRKRNPEKAKAHNKLRRAIKSGLVLRADCCGDCGEICAPHAHHEDYGKPLDVRWLCAKCHGKAHRKYKDEAI